MNLPYKIIISDKLREKLYKNLLKNPNYKLIINLDNYKNLILDYKELNQWVIIGLISHLMAAQ